MLFKSKYQTKIGTKSTLVPKLGIRNHFGFHCFSLIHKMIDRKMVYHKAKLWPVF